MKALSVPIFTEEQLRNMRARDRFAALTREQLEHEAYVLFVNLGEVQAECTRQQAEIRGLKKGILTR